ncbi:Chromosome-associated kinesin kif4a [Boothiomyces sp. JEL0866]|nr:Chromosome-associated kinesin kif4a [Boothiomyces sp. JEL0866]
MQTTNPTVQVAVRLKPLIEGDSILQNSDLKLENNLIVTPTHTFEFNHCFGISSTQEEIFNIVTPFLNNFVEGYNCTILAYGQTGSGKTHTMGTTAKMESDSGIIPRACEYIFHAVNEKAQTHPSFDFDLEMSFLEIYNEEIFDLLDSNRKSGQRLALRSGRAGSAPIFAGLTLKKVEDMAQIESLLTRGAKQRQTASTAMNSQSSRSHAIFSLSLSQSYEVEGKKIFLGSKLNFVDLAGSERLKSTKSVGERIKEGISINSGLLTLGKVINILASHAAGSTPKHVPYRESKLTRILQDSLGGNSQTLMIACVNSTISDLSETTSTLQFATRAMSVRTNARVQQTFEDFSSETLREQLEIMGEKLLEAQAQLEQSEIAKSNLSMELEHKHNICLDMQGHIEILLAEISELREERFIIAESMGKAEVDTRLQELEELLASRDAEFEQVAQDYQIQLKELYALVQQASSKKPSQKEPASVDLNGMVSPTPTHGSDDDAKPTLQQLKNSLQKSLHPKDQTEKDWSSISAAIQRQLLSIDGTVGFDIEIQNFLNWLSGWLSGHSARNRKQSVHIAPWDRDISIKDINPSSNGEISVIAKQLAALAKVAANRLEGCHDEIASECLKNITDLIKPSTSDDVDVALFWEKYRHIESSISWLEGWMEGTINVSNLPGQFMDSEATKDAEQFKYQSAIYFTRLNDIEQTLNKIGDVHSKLWSLERKSLKGLSNVDIEIRDTLTIALSQLSDKIEELITVFNELKTTKQESTAKDIKELSLKTVQSAISKNVAYHHVLNKVLDSSRVLESDLQLLYSKISKGEDVQRADTSKDAEVASDSLTFFQKVFQELTTEIEQMVELDKRLQDSESRLRSRDLYLQNTIIETAKRVHTLEQTVAELQNEKEDLLNRLENSSPVLRKSTSLNKMNSQEMQEEMEVDQWLREVKNKKEDTDDKADMDALFALTQTLTTLAEEKELLEADLCIVRLQVEHLEAVSKERDAVLADLITKRDSASARQSYSSSNTGRSVPSWGSVRQ